MNPNRRKDIKAKTDYGMAQLIFAYKLLDPENNQTLEEIRIELEDKGHTVSRATLMKWKRDPVFVAMKNKLQDNICDQYEGEIYRSLIDKARHGSFKHQSLYFQVRGKLVNKVQHLPADNLPTDPEKIQAEIDKLILQTTPLQDQEEGEPSPSTGKPRNKS